MKIKITLLLIISTCFNAMAQSPEATAKYHFIEAQNAYGNGDNNAALTNLQSCVETLTKTNSKIEALYTYIYLNKKEYLKAEKHITVYFEIAKEDHSDYMKMISLLKEVTNKAKESEQKEIERIQKELEQKQIEKLAKENEDRKQEKLNTLLEGSRETTEILFNHKKYYLVNYLSNAYTLFSNSSEVLIEKRKQPISYLGDGYFEIFVRSLTTGANPQRTSIIYDLKKNQRTKPLTVVGYPKYNCIILYDDELQKQGFLYSSTLVLPRYDNILNIGERISGFLLHVQNNNFQGIIGSNGAIIVPIKYATIDLKGPVKTTEYWCRTVEDYKIAHKYNYKGQYLGKYKMHKNGNYIKKLEN
ncbi:MAG: hypothetical protein ACI87N_000569 [Flavobacteriales bacterium]|jgi:hypothetical protein